VTFFNREELESMQQDFKKMNSYTQFDDQYLLAEIVKTKKDVEETKELMDQIFEDDQRMDYMDKKIAKLAFSFAYEKYYGLSKEAEKRGLIPSLM
jgi:hypothetical protein